MTLNPFVNDFSDSKINIELLFTNNNDSLDVLMNTKSQSFIHLMDSMTPPLISMGFNKIIYETKNKLNNIGKYKSMYVINKYEHQIYQQNDDKKKIDHPNSIKMTAETFFGIQKNTILNRAFYKLWELLCIFDIVHLDDKFNSAHLAEAPGSFVQSTLFYRDKFSKHSKKDKYYCISLHSTDETIPKLNPNIDTENKNRVVQHKTVPEITKKNEDNGDITNPQTLHNFLETIDNKKMNFVTADGGFDCKDENLQEQYIYKLILSEVIFALSIQQKGGHFVLKLFESYTLPTIKLIYLLHFFYDKIYIAKPFTSRFTNSEKYIVCYNFLYDEKNKSFNKIMNIMRDIHNELHINPDKYVHDIFMNIVIDDINKYFANLIKFNLYIHNRQFEGINKIMLFIKNKEIYTNKFNVYLKDQIDGNIYWGSLFLTNNIETTKNRLQLLLEK